VRLNIRAPALLPALLLVLSACSSTGGPSLTVSEAWVREAPMTDRPGAAYLVIANSGGQADALVGASSPAAASVEVHETVAAASGMTAMHPVERIEVPAGGSVRLEPGGYHLMLMGLKDPLVGGETVQLDLQFERAGTLSVQAVVRAP
jgi:copper(I)-binding protein